MSRPNSLCSMGLLTSCKGIQRRVLGGVISRATLENRSIRREVHENWRSATATEPYTRLERGIFVLDNRCKENESKACLLSGSERMRRPGQGFQKIEVRSTSRCMSHSTFVPREIANTGRRPHSGYLPVGGSASTTDTPQHVP